MSTKNTFEIWIKRKFFTFYIFVLFFNTLVILPDSDSVIVYERVFGRATRLYIYSDSF